jgi:predicted GNAT family acetyltransferase
VTTELIDVRDEARSAWVKVLSQSDFPRALELTRSQPLINAFVASRISLGLEQHWKVGGGLWGFFTSSGLESVLFVGANIVPMNTTDRARELFGRELIRTGRRSSSLLGDKVEVLDLWNRIASVWGSPREIRETQPFMSLDSPALGQRDARVRHVQPDELPLLLPASIHMFTEEVGVSPVQNGGHDQYERRVAEVIAERRAYAIIENRRVVFKAEVGFSTPDVAQLQGVWVAPDLRGRGMAGPAIASVVDLVQREVAPSVTLYVNDFNIAALRTYTTIGFRECGTFATILF